MDIPSVTALRLSIKAIEDAAARKTLCLTSLQALFPGSLDKTDTQELENERFDLLSVALHLRKQLKLRGFIELPAKPGDVKPKRAKKKQLASVTVRIRPTKAATQRGGLIMAETRVVFDEVDVKDRQDWSNIQWGNLALRELAKTASYPINHSDYIATVQRS